jgi:iron complex outermembrane recepter protein
MNKFYIILSLLFLSSTTKAQRNVDLLAKTDTLQGVFVIYQAEKSTPITFLNINTKQLDEKSVGQEPSTLLSETPSITAYFDAGNTQGYSYFRLRGIDQTRINVTFDGVPLNEPEDQGAYFSNYPDLLNSVSKIQIQRGVGTSKNGMASYGGSVQLFSPDLSEKSQRTLGVGYGSFNSFRGFGEYNSDLKNGKNLYVRASKVYADGYKYHSSNDAHSLFVSHVFLHKKSSWKTNFLLGQQRNKLAWLGVSDSLISIDKRTNTNSNEKDKFNQGLAQIQHFYQINNHFSVQSSAYYVFLKGSYDFDFNNFIGQPSTNELYNYAFKSNLLGLFSNLIYTNKNLNWTSGIHANTYNRQHIGSEKTLGKLYENTGFKKDISLFSKVDYKLNQLTFFSDIQYRHADFEYKGTAKMDKINWNFLNPKIGLSYNLNAKNLVYYSLGKTSREPTRNDLFGGNDDLLVDSLGNTIIFNKIPEKVIDHELGFRTQTEQFQMSANFFYMDFKNEIVLDGKFGPNGLALTNKVGKSFRTGIELSLSYKLNKNITFINNSAYNYSKIKEKNEIFTPILTPALVINQEITYQKNKFLIGFSARFQDKSYLDFANSATIKAYTLLNGRLQYKIEKFDFSLFVNNISNAQYFNNGYVDFDNTKKYFVQAPTNVYAALQFHF